MEKVKEDASLLTIQQAMAAARVSRNTIYTWMKTQKITTVTKIKRHPRILAASLPLPKVVKMPVLVLPSTALMDSTHRWKNISDLLRAFERIVEMSARLDVYEKVPPSIGHHHQGLAQFSMHFMRLELQVVHQLDMLTAERLRIDLLIKQQRALVKEAV